MGDPGDAQTHAAKRSSNGSHGASPRANAHTSSQHLSADLIDLLTEEILAVPARVWQQTFAGLLEYDDRIELPLIQAPTLLVRGDADPLVSREMQDRLVGSIPGADLLVYPGVGHTFSRRRATARG